VDVGKRLLHRSRQIICIERSATSILPVPSLAPLVGQKAHPIRNYGPYSDTAEALQLLVMSWSAPSLKIIKSGPRRRRQQRDELAPFSIDRSGFDPCRISSELYRIGSLDDRDFAERHPFLN
jgi:hypothetical protein